MPHHLSELEALGDLMFKEHGWQVNRLPIDIEDRNDKYVIYVDVPGLTREDIKLNVVDDTLTIVVNRQPPKLHLVKRERQYGEFVRSIPINADEYDVTAITSRLLDNGVLTVTVPRRTKQDRRIPILIES